MITAQSIAAHCRSLGHEPIKVTEGDMDVDGMVDFGAWHIQVGPCYLCKVRVEDGKLYFGNEVDLTAGPEQIKAAITGYF